MEYVRIKSADLTHETHHLNRMGGVDTGSTMTLNVVIMNSKHLERLPSMDVLIHAMEIGLNEAFEKAIPYEDGGEIDG